LIREPFGELVVEHGRQVDEQLREVELWVNIVAAAGACQAGEDGGCSSPTRVAHEEQFLKFNTTRFISRSLT